ncbi:COX15/CtaA family protein, partial [Candidatus Pelagibacter bacterium]|nr:COX15/CtaA family protein [Candidatus Pelagibacter bacterium]
IHLSTAIIIISLIFWLLKNFDQKKNKVFFVFSKHNIPFLILLAPKSRTTFIPFLILVFLIFLQIIFGAFVSGLDAGKIYQTWPLMGESFFPNDVILDNIVKYFEFDNHSLVQFYHRNLAYIIILYVLYLAFSIYRTKIVSLYKSLNILIFFLFLQALLGVFTLISNLNIYLASAHQITSVLLILSALNLYYLRVK